MAIQYRMLEDGAFIAGDTNTGRTAYAYPTSSHATLARRLPARIAAEMIASANRETVSQEIRDDYDERNWTALRA